MLFSIEILETFDMSMYSWGFRHVKSRIGSFAAVFISIVSVLFALWIKYVTKQFITFKYPSSIICYKKWFVNCCFILLSSVCAYLCFQLHNFERWFIQIHLFVQSFLYMYQAIYISQLSNRAIHSFIYSNYFTVNS